MFQKKLKEIVDNISNQNQLFEGKGFIRDAKSENGFIGITDDYQNYFYAYIKSEEDEDKYKLEDREGMPCAYDLEFTFKLIFDLNVYCDDFLHIIATQLSENESIKVTGLSDESELIYKSETGGEMTDDKFDYYSFTCKYKGLYYLDSSCIKNKTITKENCKPINKQ